MTLLPLVVWLGAPVHHRYQFITSDVRGIITEAAAAALASHKYDLALEWLEQGRCFVWNQLLQLRNPFNNLASSYPDQAKELQSLSHLLKRASLPRPSSDLRIANKTQTPHEAAQQHRQWAKRREESIDEIRLLPGMSDFLLPPKAAQLVDHVRDGVVAIINVDKLGCDAIIIQAGTLEISRVPLGGCSLEKLDSARIQLEDIHSMRGARRPKWLEPRDEPRVLFRDILSMLWYDLVKPVLHHLNITQVLPVDDLPHITWCITGRFSFLPVHAAGDYNQPETVIANLAISSHIPNLSALRQSHLAPSEFKGILAVGHESSIPSRELSALPGTKTELDQAAKQFEGFRCTRLDGEEALVGSVLQAMPDHSWVHFAYHASQNFLDPLNSALHLHDRDLSLAEIYQTPIQGAELAFLSACETATGELGLPDEVLHLAAGLH